ncbi:MAG: hypothetical protein SWY16_27060 [Cyanobacteriota bacterium]|nr:hypothetical protein [Cyanobacteriota bacterium]
MKYSVKLDSRVRQLSQTLPIKSKLDFEKRLDRLRQDGCLTEELPVAGDRLFAFDIDGDWVAIVQRQECRNWRGSRTIEIEVLDLVAKSEFDRSANRATPESASGGTEWPEKLLNAIALLIHHPHLTIRVGVVVTSAIGLFAVAHQSQGEVKLKMETDGTKVNSEFTIDGRQSE